MPTHILHVRRPSSNPKTTFPFSCKFVQSIKDIPTPPSFGVLGSGFLVCLVNWLKLIFLKGFFILKGIKLILF